MEMGHKKDTNLCPFVLLHPAWFPPIPTKLFGMNGGDDGARTRDLCRDTVHFVDWIVDQELNRQMVGERSQISGRNLPTVRGRHYFVSSVLCPRVLSSNHSNQFLASINLKAPSKHWRVAHVYC